MKAAKLYGIEDIRIEDVPIPEINDNEVLLKVKAAFICGTDVRFYKTGLSNDRGPLTLGHEVSGIIEKIGKNVNGYTIGQRVAIAPNYGCGVCDLCTSGRTHMCKKSEAIGVTIDGAFAEYLKIPAKAVQQGNISPLSDGISFEEAALAEPLSCVFNAYEKIGIHPGDKVLVIGAGPIGLMHVKMATMAGASSVYVNDLSESRLALAKEIIPTCTPIKENLLQTLTEATNGDMMDVVITAASVPALQELAFQYAGLGGRIMFFGGLPKGRSIVQLDTNQIHYKQLTVAGTTRQSLRQYRTCLKLIESGKLPVKDLITSQSPIEDLAKVIEDIAQGKGLKSVIII